MAETFRRMTALLVFTGCLLWRCDTITNLPQGRKDELKKFYELHKLY